MSDDRIESQEERLLILRDKAAREGFATPVVVLEYIAERYALPQTLKGALINVNAYAQRRGIPVDIDVARLVLEGVRPGSAAAIAADAAAAEAVAAEAALAEEAELAEHEAELVAAPEPEPEPLPLGVLAEPEPPVASPAAQPSTSPVASPAAQPSLEETLAGVLDATVAPAPVAAHEPATVRPEPAPTPAPTPAPAPAPSAGSDTGDTLFTPPFLAPEAAPSAPAPAPVAPEAPAPAPATVWFSPVRTAKKESLVTRAGRLLQRAGIADAVDEGDLVAVKLHFGEEGNTGFVHPIYLREVVRLVRAAGGKPFLTDCNTLYRGKRANAVEHLECALRNGFSYATVDAPLIIADGLDGHDAVDVGIAGYDHFDTVRIGAAAVHADAMVVVTHVKGHEATGFGGALKNVGMGLGSRSAKQRMHSDLKPEVTAEKCTACGRCVKWCPVNAITIGPDRVARIDHELCYGCGECVASCPHGAIGIQWKTEPEAIQEKIVEHVSGALDGKEGKVVYLSLVMGVSPDCDCWHFSDASVVPDVGILASTDIVAIDSAAYDLVRKARGLAGTRGEGLGEGTDKFREITGIDGTHAMSYAEKHGLGTRRYELRTLD